MTGERQGERVEQGDGPGIGRDAPVEQGQEIASDEFAENLALRTLNRNGLGQFDEAGAVGIWKLGRVATGAAASGSI
mgnify:CR=1 FL=1